MQLYFPQLAKLFRALIFLVSLIGRVTADDSSTLTERDANKVWFPHKDYPKLTCPQWVGEKGVECVVVLAIDDMRESAKYEEYLRPILQRLKTIDGRAPVSIMTCVAKPDDPQLQSWLHEGLSIECHTFTHPCPLLTGKDITASKATYDKCIDVMASIPNNRPVAFRTPCCDSLNTVSPRFYTEIFNRTTPGGNFLQLDSSVFILYTPDDPEIPRQSLFDEDGRETFRKYIPRGLKRGEVTHDHFVNLIENYPYPFVIQNLCWQFPCMVPSDWSANHLHKPNNPDTVRDLKHALDITVKKQGVMNLVFHPHGWIQPEQVVELIDHAVTTHGTKVKFLNFYECVERLNNNVLGGGKLRDDSGNDAGWRLTDVNHDGLMDVVRTGSSQLTRTWNRKTSTWSELKEDRLDDQIPKRRLPPSTPLPSETENLERGLRLVDINEDDHLDLIFSNHKLYGAWLFDTATNGWTIELLNVNRGAQATPEDWPPIARQDGSDNGFFVRDRELCWINEDTSERPDMLIRISFDKLLGDRIPEAKSPQAALKSMHVKPGYAIELVAHEPLTMDPVAFDWGPDGKFWVAEMADYPLGMDGQGTPGGRIRYLEDTDDDGHYDKSTLFLEGVPFPSGVISWKKGVLISAAPDIIYAEDTDNDGKADRREVLYTGFVEGNQQHRTNGFTRGLDNWLYLANGDSGGRVQSIKTGQILDLSGYDLKIRPETGDMEVVAGATQFGRNRDDWGNWFGNNNSRPMWHFVLDDHYLRRNPHLVVSNFKQDVSVSPGAAPVFPVSKTMTRFNDFHTANRFTSACSAIVDRGNFLFGSMYAGKLRANGTFEFPTAKAPFTGWPEFHTFVSEPVHNLVHHEVMKANGSSFTSQRSVGEEESEFVSSTDNWFRPTMLRTGPDGSLWIADMYRLVIEHPQWIPIEWQRKLNVRAGDDKGRIWRVYPVSTKPGRIPRLDKLSLKELVETLDSANGWQRDLAQQMILDKPEPGIFQLLRIQALSAKTPLGRIHSLCALDGLERRLIQNLLSSCLDDTHPGVRRHAIRLLERFNHPDQTTIVQLSKLLDDPDPQVRLQLAHTLGEFQHPAVGKLLGQLIVRASGDSFQLAAALSSLNEENLPDVLTEVLKSLGDQQSELFQVMLDQVAAFRHQPGLILLLDRVTEPTPGQTYEKWQYSAIEHFQNSLNRQNDSLNRWIESGAKNAKSITPRLLALFAAARKLSTNPEAAIDDRVAAARILGQSIDVAEDRNALDLLLAPQEPPELQSAALIALSRSTTPDVATKLLARFRSYSPSIRTQTCEILLSRESWRDELIKALEAKQISASDLDATTRQQLLTDRSQVIRERASRLLSANLNTDRAKLVASYLPTVRKGGDVVRGGQLFQKTCSQCHKLANVGHSVGPDLSSLADKSAEVILTAVLDPNRAVEARYITFTAITKQGVTHSGVLASETSTSVTLRAAEGKEVTLLRSEIDELLSNAKSLMPEGLEKDLKPDDAAALVSYIRTNVPLPVAKQFPGNQPRVVQADATGKLILTPFEAEIYGPTIIIEEQYRNLGFWSSVDDIVVWTINVPQAGVYLIEWNWACDPQAAGNSVVVEAAGKSITHRVQETANWDDYQIEMLGEIELPQGEVRFTLKPGSRPLPGLADVKSVTLKKK